MNKKKKSAEVSVTFRSPSFRFKGVKYISKDVEKAVAAGDEDAKLLVAQLIKIKSGVLIEVETEVDNRSTEGGSETEGGNNA